MNILTKRQQHIFQLFLESTECMTSQKLSSLLKVSTKTIQTEIKSLNQIIQKFAIIQSYPSKGYQFIIHNQELFNTFQKTLYNEFIPTNSLERAYYILGVMLRNQDFMKIDDLSEMLYIDRTAISRSLKMMRECLERYGLNVIQKTGKGLKIVGDEFRYRQCMAEYIYHKPEMFYTEIGKNEEFMRRLKEIIFNDGITMPERVFYNFVIHIQVQIDRIQEKRFIKFEYDEIEKIENEYEFLVAKDIAQLIYELFQIELSRQERDYLTIHILGKKSNSTSAIESCIHNQLIKEIDDIVQKMFDHIKAVFKIDLSSDMYLRKAIGIHIYPMENRLKFNTYLRNPLIDFIKEKYLYAYMMSLEAWEVLTAYHHCLNIEDEIGYIAIHFQYALERRKRNICKKRVLLVNDYSVAISELLNFSILKKYRDQLVIENTISASELYSYDLSHYDYLITTTPIILESAVPIIKVNPISTDRDLDVLQKYLQKNIHYGLCDFLSENDVYEINASSREYVYELLNKSYSDVREIELQNQIVILFMPRYSDESKVSVILLRKAILWKNCFVKIIIVFEIGSHNEDMIDGLQRLLLDTKRVEMLVQSSNNKEVLKFI